MLELLVADAGDAAKLFQRSRAGGRDAVDGGIVQHDIGRHAALAGDLRTPRPKGAEQVRIASFTVARWRGSKIAAPGFGSAGAKAGAGGFLAQHYFGPPF